MLEDHPDVLKTDPHLFSPLVIPSDRPRRTNFLLGQETNIAPRSDGETDDLTEPDEDVVDRFEKAVGQPGLKVESSVVRDDNAVNIKRVISLSRNDLPSLLGVRCFRFMPTKSAETTAVNTSVICLLVSRQGEPE